MSDHNQVTHDSALGVDVFTTKSRPTRRMGGKLGIGILTAGMTLALAGTPADAAPSASALADKLVRQVTIDNINRHLIAFQRFRDRAGGSRANYTAGFTGSLDYVSGKLRDAGFDVS